VLYGPFHDVELEGFHLTSYDDAPDTALQSISINAALLVLQLLLAVIVEGQLGGGTEQVGLLVVPVV
jgi:hypothetical protein